MRSVAFALMLSTAPASAGAEAVDGKIVIFRPSAVLGAAVACPVRVNGRELVELGRGKFAEWPVPAGRYILTNKTSSIEVSVSPGETRYVRCIVKAGFLSGRADLQIADDASFIEHASDYDRKELTPR